MTDHAAAALEIVTHIAETVADVAHDPNKVTIANAAATPAMQGAVVHALLAIADAIRDSNQSNKCPSESPNGNPCIRANWHTGNHEGPRGGVW